MVGGGHQTPIRQESEGRNLEAIIAVKCDVASESLEQLREEVYLIDGC